VLKKLLNDLRQLTWRYCKICEKNVDW